MLPPYPSCDFACFVQELAVKSAATLNSGVHLIRVILGGLVLWVGLVIARWILKNSSFGGRKGRRR